MNEIKILKPREELSANQIIRASLISRKITLESTLETII